MAHYCNEHKTPFFKKGKMRRYAHPIKDADGNDTGEWCNEPEGQTEVEKQGKPFTYSPEKSASIETQVAVKATTDLWIADKFKADDKEVQLLRDWIMVHLSSLDRLRKVAEEVLAVKDTPSKEDEKVVYALDTQLATLKEFELKHPGKSQEFMNKHGFKKKLTKANAGILIDEFVILESTK